MNKGQDSAAPVAHKRIGVLLNGKGYRALAFHLGTFQKLHELDLLSSIDVLSANSEGAILGASYCLNDRKMDSFFSELQDTITSRNFLPRMLLSRLGLRAFLLLCSLALVSLLLFTPYWYLSLVSLVLILMVTMYYRNLFFPYNKIIESVYDAWFFQNKSLSALADKPQLIIAAFNRRTGLPFVFTKNYMQEWTAEGFGEPVKFDPSNFPISKAVRACSCSNYSLFPVTIPSHYRFPGSPIVSNPVLNNGTASHNRNFQKTLVRDSFACNYVIVSDSEGENQWETLYPGRWAWLRMFRFRTSKKVIAVPVQAGYISMSMNPEDTISDFLKHLSNRHLPAELLQLHDLKKEWMENPTLYHSEISGFLKERISFSKIDFPADEEKRIARGLLPGLNPLNRKAVESVVKHAKALTELQIKLYHPGLIKMDQKELT